MPHQVWKHKCSVFGLCWQGTEVCRYCGRKGKYDGWGYTGSEAMLMYQERSGLKPIGKHRKMADELLSPLLARCATCNGKGLLDVDGLDYEDCPECDGTQFVPTDVEEFERRRQQVLKVYPRALATATSGPCFRIMPKKRRKP